jgi:hypothetical protein
MNATLLLIIGNSFKSRRTKGNTAGPADGRRRGHEA